MARAYMDSAPSRDEEYYHDLSTKGVKLVNPSKILRGYNSSEAPNDYFKRRRFMSGVSNCKSITFIRASLGNSREITSESLENLENMLHFKSEPCYERPYRLLADSKLCLKGNCHTITSILRPGW